ncbi:MAG: pyruvate kinase [Bacteroidota bacterium]|jgi:pyruvate kinase
MATNKAMFSKTKIVCTIGPASQSLEVLKGLIRAGMDVTRLNFSHGTREEHTRILENIRIAATFSGEPLTIMQDLGGPKIRIGNLASPSVELTPRSTIVITTEQIAGTAQRVSTTYENLPKDVRQGNTILLDDGKLQLRVERVEKNDTICKVIRGGTLLPHKGMNLPGVAVSVPSMTEKDKEDLVFGLEQDIDYVALSFVRTAHDITYLREFIVEHGRKGTKIPIIAKIEKPEAIDNIDSIIEETDGVMVARGDLGVELPAEEVPLLQKMIVRKCNQLGKPVIIATQMLESMVGSATPTRAEANDVANAVLDGADAVMLSAETSIGQYPVQAVEVMDRIIRGTEEHAGAFQRCNSESIPSIHVYDPLSRAACLLADQVKASAIVALTHSGSTAAHAAKFRPAAPIIAVTDREKIMRRLNLIWGIRGFIVENLKKDTDATFKMIEERLLKEGFIHEGDTVVMLAGIPLFEGHPTNTIKVDKV